MASQQNITSRRAVLVAASTALAGTAVAAAAPGIARAAEPHPDAELLRLWPQYKAQYALIEERCADWSEEQLDEECEKRCDVEYAIYMTPAVTLAGLAVKAKLAAEYAPESDAESWGNDDIIRDLIDEVLRLAAVQAY